MASDRRFMLLAMAAARAACSRYAACPRVRWSPAERQDLFIGEPGRPPYYIDDVVFDGEFGVTPAYRQACELRGGNGIERTGDGVLLARRDIRLELHPA